MRLKSLHSPQATAATAAAPSEPASWPTLVLTMSISRASAKICRHSGLRLPPPTTTISSPTLPKLPQLVERQAQVQGDALQGGADHVGLGVAQVQPQEGAADVGARLQRRAAGQAGIEQQLAWRPTGDCSARAVMRS